jgi:hypothetical protein
MTCKRKPELYCLRENGVLVIVIVSHFNPVTSLGQFLFQLANKRLVAVPVQRDGTVPFHSVVGNLGQNVGWHLCCDHGYIVIVDPSDCGMTRSVHHPVLAEVISL